MKTFIILIICSVFKFTDLYPQTIEVNRETSSNISIYRPHYIFNFLVKAKIFIDDTIKIELSNKELRKMRLKCGVHTFSTKRNKFRYVTNIQEDQYYYFRVCYNFNFLFGRIIIVEVTNDYGEYEIKTITDH